MQIDNKIKEDDKYIIFHSEGGQGKQILATAVIRAIKKQYPDRKIIVLTSWDAPFFYNPNVFRFYTLGQHHYFYDDYIKLNTLIFRHEVYHSEDHILQKKHIISSWCDMYNICQDGQKVEIFLNPRELEIARDKIKPDKRPILLLQTHGGQIGSQYSKKSWFRDIPIEIAQKVVNKLKDKYRILHIKNLDQPTLQNVEVLNLPLRELYAVFLLSQKRLFMDSSCQHIAAGLGLSSVVLWIGNKPEIFGHSDHVNILPNAKYVREFNKFSYLDQFDISGQIQQFPYDTVNLFNVDEIIAAVESQK
jgi:ADP-heptose:LPS heptosyltransferase